MFYHTSYFAIQYFYLIYLFYSFMIFRAYNVMVRIYSLLRAPGTMGSWELNSGSSVGSIHFSSPLSSLLVCNIYYLSSIAFSIIMGMQETQKEYPHFSLLYVFIDICYESWSSGVGEDTVKI